MVVKITSPNRAKNTIKTRAAIHTHNQNRYEELMDKHKDYMDGKPSMKKQFLEKIKKIRQKKH